VPATTIEIKIRLLSLSIVWLMCSISFTSILNLLPALSMISMLLASITCSHVYYVLCPMYDCPHVSQVILQTTSDCASVFLLLSLNGNILPISLGALNAIFKSTCSKLSFTSLVSFSAKASTLL
jgi:hypothetical protein